MDSLKAILLSVFGFYFVSGLSLGYLASYILLKTVAYLSPWLPEWMWIAVIFLFVHAVAVSATSTTGFIAVITDKTHGLKMCYYILLGLLLVEITAGLQLANQRSSLGNAIKYDMKHLMQVSQTNYADNLSDTQMWDEIQLEVNCCGIKNYQDWYSTKFGNETSVPDSCCLLITKDCGKDIAKNTEPEDEVITEGCLPILMERIGSDYKYYGLHLVIPVVITQSILILILFLALRKKEPSESSLYFLNITRSLDQDKEPLYPRLQNEKH